MKTRKSLKCPKCGGPANSYEPVAIHKNKVLVLVECWSGDINRDRTRHIYTAYIPITKRKKAKHEGSTYNQFVSEKYHEGITDFKKIAKLWKKHKKEFNLS